MRSMLPVLGLSLIAVPATAQEVRVAPVLADGTLLEIVGEGHAARVPDLATIRAGVVTQAVSAAAALQQISVRMSAVLAALKKAGIADRDIQTASISLSPQYRYAENKPPVVTGYQASNQVTVRFRDLARTGAVLDTLVAQGANSIDGPNLSIDKPDAALDEARIEAVAKARARAETYAKAAGLRVDRILSISESGAAPEPVLVASFARAKADSAPAPIAVGEQDLNVTVTVRFLLK
jgi:uncharacterized protein